MKMTESGTCDPCIRRPGGPDSVHRVWLLCLRGLGHVSLISQRNSRAQERLARLSRRRRSPKSISRRPRRRTASRHDAGGQALSAPLMPQTELEQSQLRVNLANAGFRSESALSVYLGIRFASLIAFALLGVAIFVPKYGLNFGGLKGDRVCGPGLLSAADHPVVGQAEAAAGYLPDPARRARPSGRSAWKAAWVWTRPCGRCAKR